jgi:hypothetical protein
MPISYKLNLTLLFSCITALVHAQSAKSYAVMLQRNGNSTPVKLVWDYDNDATGYTVYRRSPGTFLWGNAIGTTSKSDTFFTDNNATNGLYEYYVKKTISNGDAGHGYMLVNTKVESLIKQGRIMLLVDANYQAPLAGEITGLIRDLAADGWYVDTLIISRTEAVSQVKQKIRTWFDLYKNDAIKPQSLYLLGHIPVPYSGDIFPDGHRPDHRGAWPADVYYGVMNESIWTDNLVNVDSSATPRNYNIPGDGKFDIDYIFPDTSSLEIGRVDLTNMPAAMQSDTALMAAYLQKAHAFKVKNLVPQRKAIIDDNFGAMQGEAFASSGWRNFSTMVGINNVSADDYVTALKTQSYLLSYGCGAGNYNGAIGIGNSATLAASDSLNTVFTMLFGSYFGDWDNENAFLRAPLCSKPMSLASFWSGRPHWPLHHMSLGYTIGYCARLTQNNIDGRVLSPSSLSGYFNSSFPTYVHIGLMGDPTLRLFYNEVPQVLSAVPNSDSTSYQLTWNGVQDAVGYEIYVSQNAMHGGHLAEGTLNHATTLSDIMPGINHVYIRAKFEETSASGKFEQLSLGGYYMVTGGVNATGIAEKTKTGILFTTYPNPSRNQFTVNGNFNRAQLDVYDLTGKLVLSQTGISGGHNITHNLTSGLYLIRISSGGKTGVQKLVVE